MASRTITKYRAPDGAFMRVSYGRGSPAADSIALPWSTNDIAFDTEHTTAAIVYKCTVGGTPGTWVELDGGTGTPGLNAFTTTTASFTMPAVSSNVNVAVAQSTFMAVAQVLFVFGAGFFQVATIPDSTHVSLTNLGYPGNASPGATIATSAKVSPGGLIGPTGATGPAGVAGPPGLGKLGSIQFGTFITTVGTGSGQWIGTGGQNDVSNSVLPLPIADFQSIGATQYDAQLWISVWGIGGTYNFAVTDQLGVVLNFITLSGGGGPIQIGPHALGTASGGLGFKIFPAAGFVSPGPLDIRAVITFT